jgi:lysozyme
MMLSLPEYAHALRGRAINTTVATTLMLMIATGPVFAARGAGASAAPPALVSQPGVLSGIDVSHWQGRIDWKAVAASGIDFAIAKATDGLHMVDTWYVRNHGRARTNRVPFTAYHFARPAGGTANAIRQADHFLKVADLWSVNLIPALDLEQTGGLSSEQLLKWTLAWLHRVEQRLGVKPMVYTSPGFWRGALDNTSAVAAAGYEVLWIAHYEAQAPTVPGHRWDHNGWVIWQWTECGHVNGVHGCVDRDALRGVRLSDLTIAKARKK